MIGQQRLELWDGKKVIGTVRMQNTLGKFAVFHCVSIVKEFHNKIYKTIKVPVIYRVVSDDGVDIVTRRSLDVRRKSKRQIKLILLDF